ncbi:THAP domain-containing protein 5-like [Channa argus]|uniref:THAP domain-containing protein 5-like n=1 Tax=Channa argus TaxID=215402 RepID=UPI00351F9AA9
MKREEWTPSRHQYLCSEHFTEDCFDIRWGIRYLKNTAIPTIFPSADDAEPIIKRITKAKAIEIYTQDEPTEFDSPLKMQTAACEILGDSGIPIASCVSSVCSESHSEEQTDSTVAVLCFDSVGSFCDAEVRVDATAFQAALGQAFSLVPLKMVKNKPTDCFLDEGGPSEGEHISAYEHSYCRPDTDKDQLWTKILSLHAKILELDRREEATMAKIHALETEITLLKRDGAVFKEKQKVLEDYISSVLL